MAKKRKTINVDDLRKLANDMLATEHTSKQCREGVIMMIERVLLDTGNYCGFSYLYKSELPYGATPGIHPDPGTKVIPHTDYTERFKDTDHTRVRYY